MHPSKGSLQLRRHWKPGYNHLPQNGSDWQVEEHSCQKAPTANKYSTANDAKMRTKLNSPQVPDSSSSVECIKLGQRPLSARDESIPCTEFNLQCTPCCHYFHIWLGCHQPNTCTHGSKVKNPIRMLHWHLKCIRSECKLNYWHGRYWTPSNTLGRKCVYRHPSAFIQSAMCS